MESNPREDGTALPEVSVVMPCLNEADSVGTCVEKALRALREHGIAGEVIVADNGSTDGSAELAAKHGARVVHVAERGYGHALMGGIAAAQVAQSADACRDGSTWRAGCVFRECADCPELVVVPAGTFLMGSVNNEDWRATYEGTQPEAANVFSLLKYESPQHRVTIPKPLAIGRYEVTFDEWDRCVDEGGCRHRPDDREWGRGKRPAINLSWLDAKAYTAWLSKKTGHTYRLPSEAEWEYAARAGTSTPYWWGRELGAKQANCRDCNTGEGAKTLPVGSYKPNSFGLFDTAGNAAEWVEDCWNDNYRGAPANGSAWTSGQCRLRALRGGAFDSQARYLRATARFRYDHDVRYVANGFRVVRELP